ncbi:MAG: hypothetical protein AMS16_03665 [Planctomycetes bacterium DG_58]|nr:MAG: hypothetical protein AMS16_03665 [Planctomycetes bacterium DG_58]
MRKLLPVLVMTGVALAVLLWWGERWSAAQSPLTPQDEADSLIEKIKAIRAKHEADASGESIKRKLELTAPGEAKTDEKTSEEATSKKARPREPVEITEDPYEYLWRMGTLRYPGRRELLERYSIETDPNELLQRIRESRANQDEKKKKTTGRQETAERPATPEPTPRDYREPLPDYSIDGAYLAPLDQIPDAIGTDALRRQPGPTTRSEEISRSTDPTELPDPSKDMDRYQKALRERYGARAGVSQYSYEGLRDTYERNRFKTWLQNQHEARVESNKLDVPQLSKAYDEYQKLPALNESLGRRDVYIPYSQNYLSDTYRGTIYSRPYTSDPVRRNLSAAISQSKYSTLDYFNLNTFDAFADYYQREYGVGRSFVPGSAAGHYDINTMKQWTESLRRDYGIDVGDGRRTYAELYKLYTSKPGY